MSSKSNDGLDELRRDPAVGRSETGRGWQERPSWDGPGSMSPQPRDAERAALRGLETSMRRARFMDHLPEEERAAVTVIIGGRNPHEHQSMEHASNTSGSGASEPDADDAETMTR